MKLRIVTCFFLAMIQMCFAQFALAEASPYASLHAADIRLARIAWPLLTANAERCSGQAPGTGLVLHSLDQYGAEGQILAQRQWIFPSVVSVEAVAPGTPAALAGIRSGDGIVAIATRTDFADPLAGDGSTARRDRAEQLVAELPLQAPIALLIRRGSQEISVTLHPVPVCRARIELVSGKKVRARSDGKVIQIGQAFAATLNDNELAVAIAHELAHVILAHRSQLTAMERAGTAAKTLRTAAQAFEDEADLLSLRLLSAAGHDPGDAPHFMRKVGGRFDPVLPGSRIHRTAADRAHRMNQVIAAGLAGK